MNELESTDGVSPVSRGHMLAANLIFLAYMTAVSLGGGYLVSSQAQHLIVILAGVAVWFILTSHSKWLDAGVSAPIRASWHNRPERP